MAVNIENGEELRAWLSKQRREVSVAFAARAALRMLPMIQNARDFLVLPVFRATAISWAAANYAAQEMEIRAAASAPALGSAVSADAARSETGATPSALAGSPLWLDSPARPSYGVPGRLWSMWEEMKAALHAANEDWQVWTAWYEDRLAGSVREEARELAYVRIANELWEQGPATVNAEIKRQFPPRLSGQRGEWLHLV